MSLHIGDYLKDTGHLRTVDHGAYLLLIMHYWTTGGLPDDDRQLAAIARMSDRKWKELRTKIAPFFSPNWKHKRIDRELAEAREKYEKRAFSGSSGGKATAAKRAFCYQQNGSFATSKRTSKTAANAQQPTTYNQQEDLGESLSTSRVDRTGSGSADAADIRPAEVAGPCDWPKNYRDQFWSKYPNKIGKPKALAKLDRARKRGVAWAELWSGLERYVAKTDDRSWCNPETWINQERWTDEPGIQTNRGFSAGGSRGGSHAVKAVAAARRAAAAFEAHELRDAEPVVVELDPRPRRA
jgi:uncharacterized protein YdaU (DUF1376 family)